MTRWTIKAYMLDNLRNSMMVHSKTTKNEESKMNAGYVSRANLLVKVHVADETSNRCLSSCAKADSSQAKA
jgi:hypothetical protein